MNCFGCQRSSKKGKDFLPNLDMNRLIAAICPLKYCTSLTFLGDVRFWIAAILDGLISNPHWHIMKSKNLLACTPKVHLFRCNFNPKVCAV